jgi:hypothetical protein
MALIACPECSSKVSDRAPTSPNCGYPISRPRPEVQREPAPIRVTEVQFTRKWIKVLSSLVSVPYVAGIILWIVPVNLFGEAQIAVAFLLIIAGIVLSIPVGLIRWWHHA